MSPRKVVASESALRTWCATRLRGISQQMLTRTLKTLERDGMVERTVSGPVSRDR